MAGPSRTEPGTPEPMPHHPTPSGPLLSDLQRPATHNNSLTMWRQAPPRALPTVQLSLEDIEELSQEVFLTHTIQLPSTLLEDIRVVPEQPLPEKKSLNDQIVLTGFLGDGGYGKVYVGEDRTSGRKFAVKLFADARAADLTFRKRILQEAQLTASIRHRNVVGIEGVGVSNEGHPFILMERLRGETLEAKLARDQFIRLEPAIQITVDVCAALGAAHAKSVIHRDIKPSNVFLRPASPTPFVTVLDFGLAKIIDEQMAAGPQLTPDGTMFGTPRYMSPEQCAGGKADRRSDVYSTAILLYEMLVGKPPFDAENFMQIMKLQMVAKIPDVCVASPQMVPRAVAAVIERAMAKAPNDRYQTVHEFASALLVALAARQDPPVALPPSNTVRSTQAPPQTTQTEKLPPSGSTTSQTGSMPDLQTQSRMATLERQNRIMMIVLIVVFMIMLLIVGFLLGRA